ncbi:MAG: hypothetical protein DRI94_04395 [Bacteroidetes bacterium]|nr:MAG: hypothetical protein DRI94_04395 [Bacteroidota bacterium]
MKKITLVLLGILIMNAGNAQEWRNFLPEKKITDISFFEYQKAFNLYWDNKNVKDGKCINEKGETEKAYGWNQFRRWENYWETRVDKKTGMFPYELRHKAFADFQIQKSVQKDYLQAWNQLGPNITIGGYNGLGRLNTIAFHPTDANTFWVGAPAGGLWLTETGGDSWIALTDSNEVLGVSAVIVPSDYVTSNTIYIGTGDRDAFDNYGVGVLKSIDGGLHWNTTGLSFNPGNGDVVNNMLIDPTDNNILYAATSAGLYKSIDAGQNWSLINASEFIDIEFHPANSQIIYGSSRSNGFIDKTTDGGSTWNSVFSNSSAKRIELTVSPAAPDVVYALASNASNGLKGIYKSTDSGDSFTLIYDDKPILNWSEDGTGTNNGQGWYDLSFAVDPTNADVLYCGGVNTWKSVDGGLTWNISNHWYGGGGVQAVHADKHYFSFRPGSSDFYECNDGGVYLSADGNSWTDLSDGLIISQMYGLSVSRNSPNISLSGLQDNGTKMIEDGIWIDAHGGDGMKCLVDFNDDNIQYGSGPYGDIYRTTNLWGVSINIADNISGGPSGSWVTPYVFDPNNSNTLFVGYSTLWKTINQGQNFQNIGSFGSSLHSIAVSNLNPEVLYVAKYSSIYKTTNNGYQWTEITNNLPLSNSSIKDIEIKKDDDNTVWVALSGYNSDCVYMTADGGNTWTDISQGLPDIPVNTLVQNDLESTIVQLYTGTDFGTYIKNGNDDWVLFGAGLPKVDVTELDIYYDRVVPENSRLRASSYGRGMWEVPLELSGNYSPYITTDSIKNLTNKMVTVYGTIVDDFSSGVTESGFVLSRDSNPDLSDIDVIVSQTNPVVGIGNYFIDINGLSNGSDYYVKSYAINPNGISYGKEISFTTDATSVEDVKFNDLISIYPNPSNGVFNIGFKETEKTADVSISDMTGKLVYSNKLNTSENHIIKLNYVSKGIYFIKINLGDKSVVSKLIIQ